MKRRDTGSNESKCFPYYYPYKVKLLSQILVRVVHVSRVIYMGLAITKVNMEEKGIGRLTKHIRRVNSHVIYNELD